MKKSLLAIAAAGAFAGAAQAQSSVTVYGVIDAGVAASNTTYGAGGANTIKQTVVGGLSSANGTGQEAGSRLGFRGTEDIGGGSRVGFTFETAVTYTNGQATNTAPSASDTTLANGTAMFGNTRQAFASLSNNNFGELRIGTQDSLAKNLLGFYDPTKEAITTGATSLYQQAVTTRFGQAATYQAPTLLGGLVLRAQYANDGSTYGTVSGANTATTNNAWSVSGKFDRGPLSIGAVYEVRLQFQASAGTNNSATALNPNGTTAGLVPSINQTGVAAQYNFGVVTPMISYYNQKWNNPVAAGSGSLNGIQLGATAPITPTISLVGSYITGKVRNNNTDLYNTAGYQAQVNYALSKRSRLYAIWGQTNWNTQVTTTSDVKVQQYGLGLLHTF